MQIVFGISVQNCRRAINVFLCITQLGFCCVYFVFVAVNLQEVIAHYFMKFDIRLYLLLLLIPMIALNFLKNLKYLAPVSLFASILTVTGEHTQSLLASLFFFIFAQFSIHKSSSFCRHRHYIPLHAAEFAAHRFGQKIRIVGSIATGAIYSNKFMFILNVDVTNLAQFQF